MELARLHGERGNEAMALRLVGESAVAGGDAAGATALREAVGLAETLEMGPLLADCRAGLARAGAREELGSSSA